MLWTLFIVILMAGCGDVSVPAAPGYRPSEPDPVEPGEPVFEVSCSETRVEGQYVYFYAQTKAPEGEFQAFRCTESDSPTAPPLCDATMEYVIDEGVLRVSCGEWDGEAEALGSVADFVRIERAKVE